MTGSKHVMALTRPGALQERLAQAFARSDLKGVAIGFAYRDRAGFAALGSNDAAGTAPIAAAMPTGCLTKLFTAALVRSSIAAGRLSLEQRALDLLGMEGGGPACDALRGVTVKHLLEHTHGLDDSGMRCVPLRSDGYIDAAALCAKLRHVGRLAPPGEVYSYAHVGAWVLGAILERRSGRRYEELLQADLFEPLGMTICHRASALAPNGGPQLCPSMGGSLSVPIDDLLAFLRAALPGGIHCAFPDSSGDAPGDDIVPLPGWSSFERGVRLAWKHYGSGWFGHSSEVPGAFVLARVHPADRIAIIVAAENHSPVAIATTVFGKILPQFLDPRMPKLLTADEAARLDLAAFEGVFQNDAVAVKIGAGTGSRLQLRAFRRCERGNEPEPFFVAALRPARDRVFFTQPAELTQFPFVQFIETVQGGYLWNGKSLWRRSTAPGERPPH